LNLTLSITACKSLRLLRCNKCVYKIDKVGMELLI
jgi:hypothetical protein